MYTDRGNKYLIKENKLRIPDNFTVCLQESFITTPLHRFELIKTEVIKVWRESETVFFCT